MPKLLHDAREKAILETRRILAEQGYDALTMRAIAQHCSIAVGTLYNYFPSKEQLTCCVVLEDWRSSFGKMMEIARTTTEPEGGLENIYLQMCAFVQTHQYLRTCDWKKRREKYSDSDRHALLLAQLCELLKTMFSRFPAQPAPEVQLFLAESILNSSVRQYPYEQLRIPFQKLLHNE